MIDNEKHHKLNNLMCPIVNYFSIMKEIEKEHSLIKEDKLKEFAEIDLKKIHEIMPEILNILKAPDEIQSIMDNKDNKNICPKCKGSKQYYDELIDRSFVCHDCKGTGQI